jgi:hypothetical protein
MSAPMFAPVCTLQNESRWPPRIAARGRISTVPTHLIDEVVNATHCAPAEAATELLRNCMNTSLAIGSIAGGVASASASASAGAASVSAGAASVTAGAASAASSSHEAGLAAARQHLCEMLPDCPDELLCAALARHRHDVNLSLLWILENNTSGYDALLETLTHGMAPLLVQLLVHLVVLLNKHNRDAFQRLILRMKLAHSTLRLSLNGSRSWPAGTSSCKFFTFLRKSCFRVIGRALFAMGSSSSLR